MNYIILSLIIYYMNTKTSVYKAVMSDKQVTQQTKER